MRPRPHGSRQRLHAHTHSMDTTTRRSAPSPLCSPCLLCSVAPRRKQMLRKVEERDGCMMLIMFGRHVLSRDRNVAHYFPSVACQKGHHRAKSRAGPSPTILGSLYLLFPPSVETGKEKEARSSERLNDEQTDQHSNKYLYMVSFSLKKNC
jgi:hypothetical protein